MLVLAFLLVATVSLPAQNYGLAQPIATALSCDGKGTSPDNVTTYAPMFSWTFTDADTGDAQTAYSIQVRHHVGGQLMWDLAKQDLATSTRMYGGDPLAANTPYDWYLQVWDRADRASVVAQSSFTVLDIGLQVFDGTSIVTIATDKVGIAQPVTDANRLRISKGGSIYSIVLSDTTEYGASKVRVQIQSGPKALKMMMAPPPAIGLGTGNLSFTGVLNGANPSPKTVSVLNVGGDTLSGLTASVSPAWLSSSSLDITTAPATLTVRPVTGSLAAGTHTATVTVDSGVAANEPQTVSVMLLLACSVTYNGNGATGGGAPTDANTYLPGATVTVLGNSGNLVRTGYTFAGWNTLADGSGTSYTQGQTFTMGATNVTLYARWLPTFAVSYSPNGATGGTVPTDSNLYLQGATVMVLGNSGNLVRTGYTFAGWNTLADGSGTSYTQGQTFAMGATNVTLYAKWSALPTYSVAYLPNGATGGTAPTDNNVYLQGATVTVLGNSGNLVRTGYGFAGWNMQSSGNGTTYAQGQNFAMGSANVALYARWLPTYTVTYNANGATGGSVPVDSNNYLQGATVTVLGPGTLVRTGYSFAGWHTQSAGAGTSYAAGASFFVGTSSMSMFAIWIPSNLTFTSSGTSITITGYTTAPTGSLAIPMGVTSLGVNAFRSCGGLTSVTIPSSVTEISYLAFQLCTGLTSIVIPSSVSYIGHEAFYGCFALTSISVDAANPNYKSVSGVLFDKAGTTLLIAPGGLAGSYTIPSGVTTIAMTAFEHCPSLTGVTIASTVTSIGWHAFRYCDGLSGVTIPAGVTHIDEAPFLDCSSLTGINVDPANPNYKSISGVLFTKDGTVLVEAPESMSGSYSVPAGVTSIGAAAFMYGYVTSVSLPAGLKTIEGYAFAFAHLSSVSIPSSVTSIKTYAFEGIYGLTSVTIPSNVTSIGTDAFVSCHNLSSVTVLAVTPPALPSGSRAFSYCAAGLQIHVPSGSLATYKAATGWSDYSSIIVSP